MTDPHEGDSESPDVPDGPTRTRFADPADPPAESVPVAVEPEEPAPVEPAPVEPAPVETEAVETEAVETEAAAPAQAEVVEGPAAVAIEQPVVEQPPTQAPVPEPAPLPLVLPEPQAEVVEVPSPPPLSETWAEQDVVPGVGRPPTGALVSVLVGMVVALALLTGFLAYTVVDTRGPAPVESSRKAALDAGRAAARLVFSYDYRHLAKDFSAGRATTTGTFQKEYDRTTTRLVKDVAPRYKAVVVADVSEASVVTATDTRVVLLVFVNQQSSSTLTANPKITQSRLEMTMQRVGGRWLVGNIKAL